MNLDQLRQLMHGRRILYLYSGPPREMDAVVLGKLIDMEVTAIDILRHESHDLADQQVWDAS